MVPRARRRLPLVLPGPDPLGRHHVERRFLHHVRAQSCLHCVRHRTARTDYCESHREVRALPEELSGRALEPSNVLE